jgi:hypothetical protein
MTLMSGVLFLRHAAGPGVEVQMAAAGSRACIGQAVPVGLSPGTYSLETASIEESRGGERYSCALCRWVPASRTQGAGLLKALQKTPDER